MYAAIYDLNNHRLAETAPKKVSFGDVPARFTGSIPLSSLSPGAYRIDIYANDVPVWRTFIRILE